MSKYVYNKDYFKIIDSEDKAYWLGFLYADGCINKCYRNKKLQGMHLELTVCEKDKHHLSKFKWCLSSDVPIKKKIVLLNKKEYVAYRLCICCTEICQDLIKLKCIPSKTYSIKFPSYEIVPKLYMRDFIRGYFDGDGCIYTTFANNRSHIEITMVVSSNL